MSDKLDGFLRAAATDDQPVERYCGIWLADWYMVATGKPDPAADMRGQFHAGENLIPHLRRIVRRTGLARTRTPQAGDVGLIRIGKAAHGAIFTGSRWAFPCDIGMSTAPSWYPCMAAWRVE